MLEIFIYIYGRILSSCDILKSAVYERLSPTRMEVGRFTFINKRFDYSVDVTFVLGDWRGQCFIVAVNHNLLW